MDNTSKKPTLENQPPNQRVPNMVVIQNQNIYPTSDHSTAGEKKVIFHSGSICYKKNMLIPQGRSLNI